jgi:hypothetical protein
MTYRGLDTGTHTFLVRAAHADGSEIGQNRNWRVDATAPSVHLASPAFAFRLARTATASFSATDAGGAGVMDYDVRYYTRNYRGTASRVHYPSSWQGTPASTVRVAAAPGTTDCFSVRAWDRAGNVSPWSTPHCSSRVLDDRALTAHGHWLRAADAKSYLGTRTTTTADRATLSLGSVPAERLAVLATVGPREGRLSVFVAGQFVGAVRLRASAVQHRVLVNLPAVRGRVGIVTLIAHRGRVWVDGIGVARAA